MIGVNYQKISVIVPVYNVESYINRCVDSILHQSYKNIEIILVDDGSTDGSPEICDEYDQNNENIIVIHKKNGGLSSARNIGLEHASGEIISFVDSDDYIHPYMYEYLVHNMVEYDADISNCKVAYLKGNKIPKNDDYSKQTVKCYSNIDILKIGLLKDAMYIDCACNNIYKKSLWDNIRFPIGMYHEDRATIFQTIYLANKIVHTDFKGYFYCLREGSITRSPYSCKHAFDQLNAMETKYDILVCDSRLADVVKVKASLECLDIWTKLAMGIDRDEKLLYKLNEKFKGFYDIKLVIKYSDFYHIIGSILFSLNKKLYLKLYSVALKFYCFMKSV